MKKTIFITLICIFFQNLSALNIDSLKKSINKQNVDTNYLNAILKIGNLYYYEGNLDSSLKYFTLGLNNSKTLNFPKYICSFYSELGTIYREKGIYDKASENILNALTIADANKFDLKKASCYNSIAIVYTIQKQFEKAFEFYNKAMVIYQKKNNLGGQASINNNLGLIYLEQKKNDEALDLFNKAKTLNFKVKNFYGVASNSENIGLIFENLKQYDSAQIYYEKAYKIWESRKDTHSLSINMGYIGKSLINQNKFKDAITILTKALSFSKRINSKSTERDISLYLSKAYEETGNLNNAFKFYKLGNQLNDSLLNSDKLREITEMQLNYTFNKKQLQDSVKHSLEVNEKENEIISQKKNASIAIVFLGVFIILLFFVIRGYFQKNKTNKIITEQKLLVEQKQKEILDSINYAKKIQNTLLANQDFLNENIKNNFIYYNPKDIVSGDFYWATLKNNLFYLAVCDSTGHGVPGAFMSLLNIGYLSEAINEKNIINPNDVFNYVREKLITSLSKDGQKDGFDGLLICLNKESNQITYAAANNKLILVRDGNLTELASDRMPVGLGVKSESFKHNLLQLKPNDALYIYTDGFADQFGGVKGKKFKYKQLNEILLNNAHLPLKTQKDNLASTFENWKGNLEQVDDVCIIGLQF